jgi:hypothetical protein
MDDHETACQFNTHDRDYYDRHKQEHIIDA